MGLTLNDWCSPDVHKHLHIDGLLPYELVALECALAAFVKGMEEETTELELRAATSLESLTLKVIYVCFFLFF